MSEEPESPKALSERDLNYYIVELKKLGDLTKALQRNMGRAEIEDCAKPEFIARSISSIHDSQVIMTDMIVRILVTLRDGVAGEDNEQEAYQPEAPKKPNLRLVDPD